MLGKSLCNLLPLLELLGIESITTQMCTDLKNVNLEVKNRGYDDVSNMCSDHVDVQAYYIRKESPLAVYYILIVVDTV